MGANYRDDLRKFLSLRGIETGLHYYPNHKLTLFRRDTDNCPNTEKLGEELITLPLHTDLGVNDIDDVISGLKSFDTTNNVKTS